jgi:hypothetical protein
MIFVSGGYSDMDLGEKMDCRANGEVIYLAVSLLLEKEMGYAIKSFWQKQPIGGTPCCRQR